MTKPGGCLMWAGVLLMLPFGGILLLGFGLEWRPVALLGVAGFVTGVLLAAIGKFQRIHSP